MSDYDERKFDAHQNMRRAFMTEDQRKQEDEAQEKIRQVLLGCIVKRPQHKDTDHE
jgi:hypothetical protein